MPDGKKDKAGGSAGASVPGGKKETVRKEETKKQKKKENRKSVGRSRNGTVGNRKNIPTTAQQSIPYIRMLQDGILPGDKDLFLQDDSVL